jgi:hypothetical protein
VAGRFARPLQWTAEDQVGDRFGGHVTPLGAHGADLARRVLSGCALVACDGIGAGGRWGETDPAAH